MKIFLSVTLAGLLLAFTASADPVFGVWKTQPGNEGNYAYVEIKECDGKICGEMLKAFDSSDKEIDSKNIGRNIILGMSPKKMVNTVEVRSGLLTKIKLIDQR